MIVIVIVIVGLIDVVGGWVGYRLYVVLRFGVSIRPSIHPSFLAVVVEPRTGRG